MSFVVNGHLDTSHLRLDARFVEKLKGEILDSMTIVRQEGEEFLRDIIQNEAFDTGALLATAHGGSNAYSVYWRVLEAPGPGRDAKYGVYQDKGWTDKAGQFHAGKFFMERTEAFGAVRLMQLTGAILADNGFGRALANLPNGYLDTGGAAGGRKSAEFVRQGGKQKMDAFDYAKAQDAFGKMRLGTGGSARSLTRARTR